MSSTQFQIDAGVLTSSKAAVLVVTAEGKVLASNPMADALVDAVKEGHTPEVMGYIGRAAVTGHPMNETVLLPASAVRSITNWPSFHWRRPARSWCSGAT